jgi:hypothetical protein
VCGLTQLWNITDRWRHTISAWFKSLECWRGGLRVAVMLDMGLLQGLEFLWCEL